MYSSFRGPVPGWVKSLRARGYVNIFELSDPETLYGTEHLCGDWDGELLVVAKDFAPAPEVQALLAAGLPWSLAYRHNDGDGRFKTGLKTNRQLMKWLFDDPTLVDGRIASRCGVVYASACFFLKPGSTSAVLGEWHAGSDVWEGSRLVLAHSIGQMPNLRAIVALGSDALQLLGSLYGFAAMPVSDAIGRRFGGGTPVYVAPHPSRGSNESHLKAWAFIRADSGIGS